MQILSKESSSSGFRGVFTALATPFLPDGAVDLKGFERLVESQITGGVHGVVPCGTTGESPVLSTEEKLSLIAAAVRLSKGRALVIAGTGSNDTLKTIKDSKAACAAGVDGLLVVTPYYNKPTQEGLEAHFRAVADESSVPVVLYNVPGRTGVSLAPETVARLSCHPRITGIKEASGNLSLLGEMKAAVQRQEGRPARAFTFLSGDDVTFWPFLACGGDGVISVASNILPACLRMMYEDWNEGRVGSGLALHEKLSPFFNALFIESNPAPLKAVLSWQSRMNAKVRLPLVGLRPDNAAKLKAVWDSLLPHLKSDKPREDIRG